MTPRDAAYKRVQHGYCLLPDVACALHVDCGISTAVMYAESVLVLRDLLRDGLIVKNEQTGVYSLPVGVTGR